MRLTIAALSCLLLMAACNPEPSPPTTEVTTTSAQTTTTSSSTTTTSSPNTTDETAIIQETLDDEGYFLVDRTYVVNSPLSPPAGSTIDFGPSGKFLRTSAVDGTRTLPILSLSEGNITVNNAVIEGPNTGRYYRDLGGVRYYYAHEGTGIGGVDPNMEENGGIVFSGGSNYEINNPRIESVWGDGFTINTGASDIVINNPQVLYVGRSIISNLESHNVTINGGYGTGAYWWGVNIETIGNRVVSNFTVNNLELWYTRYESLFAGGRYSNCEIYNVNVELSLTAPFFDQYPHLQNQTVKVTSCPVGRVNVQTYFTD